MEPDGNSNRGAVVALVVIALLVGGGLWLAGRLRADGQIQDCVMAGRSNCAPIAAPQKT